jgi:hypothetical protein
MRQICGYLETSSSTAKRTSSPPHRLYLEAHRELVIILATEIYHRERGSLPPSEEALVGTYLERLPNDSSSDLAAETTPTVE